jgi:hypothetical protein
MDKEKIANEVEDTLTSLMSIVTGVKTDYKLDETQRNKLYSILSLQQENYNLNYQNMDINEQKRRIDDFMFTFTETIFGVRKSFIKVVEESLSQLLEVLKTYPFIYTTKHCSYVEALFRIVEKIYSEGHTSKVSEFSKNIDDEEFLGLFQHMRKINETDIEYLSMNKLQITKAVLDKHISIYDNLSGSLEKYLRFLVCIAKIFEGEVPDYTKIKKDKLANYIGYLSKRTIFKDLVQPINTTIRNAIAHKGSVLIDPIQESITFIDTNCRIVRSYQQFISETRELAAVWSVVSNIGIILSLYGIRKLFSSINLSDTVDISI